MKSVKKTRSDQYIWHKVVIGLIGLVLSVVLHELFHIGLHWGEIESIRFFQGSSIAEVIVLEHRDSDLLGEEVAAYLITVLVILLTVIIIYRVSDATDTRTVQQIISGDSKDMQGMKNAEFLKLANKTDLAPPPESNAWPRSKKFK